MKKIRLNITDKTLSYGGQSIALTPPPVRKAASEIHEALPLYNDNTSGWRTGSRLLAVQAHECTFPGAVVPGSIRVKTQNGEMKAGEDFQTHDYWGTVGRSPNGRILPEEKVEISYSYYPSRIDSLVLTADGRLGLKIGAEGMAHPSAAAIATDEVRLANIYWHGDCSVLNDNIIYPVTETAFPPGLLPCAIKPEKIIKKLQMGETVRILAWGDSVTECNYLPAKNRWQEQFCRRLQQEYPQAEIELLTEGWGGRTTSAFLAVPPGEEHNFERNVLQKKPDLIISEFVNDCHLPEETFRADYRKIKDAFDRINAQWVILTPHYIRPDWMDLPNSKDCDDDPRQLVKFLREFSAENKIPLADASRYWGRLYRQGIPYETLYSNGINHPLEYGLSLFADALMPLFKPENLIN